jgi:hypothetical protein
MVIIIKKQTNKSDQKSLTVFALPKRTKFRPIPFEVVSSERTKLD